MDDENIIFQWFEAAIRNKNNELLKSATYKLHEKYHSGYAFKMTSELEKILHDVQNSGLNEEVLGMLCRTISEILEKSRENSSDNREFKPETIPDVAFKSDDGHFKAENTDRADNSSGGITLFFDERFETEAGEYQAKLKLLSAGKEANPLENLPAILKTDKKEVQDFGRLITVLSSLDRNFNFVTSSPNPFFVKCFSDDDIPFKIPLAENTYTNEQSCNFLPMFGLLNLFICPECGTRFLHGTPDGIMALKCKACGGTAFPEIYDTATNLSVVNPIYWHRAFSAFLNSDLWVIVNPPETKEKECVYDFLKIVSKNANPKMIFLLEPDNLYRRIFSANCPHAKIVSSQKTVYELAENLRGGVLVS